MNDVYHVQNQRYYTMIECDKLIMWKPKRVQTLSNKGVSLTRQGNDLFIIWKGHSWSQYFLCKDSQNDMIIWEKILGLERQKRIWLFGSQSMIWFLFFEKNPISGKWYVSRSPACHRRQLLHLVPIP